MSKDRIEKGMFLLGGSYPARYAQKSMILRGGDYPATARQAPPLDEIKSRLQRVQEALDYIRGQPQEKRG